MSRAGRYPCIALAVAWLGLTVTFAFCPTARAEERCLWDAIDVGGINASGPSRSMVHLRASICYAPRYLTFFSFSIAGNADLHDFLPFSFSGETQDVENIKEFALAVGRRVVARGTGFVSCSAGLAITQHHIPYSGDWTGVGFPLDAQAVWAPFRALGIGIRGFGNVNSDRRFVGVSMSIVSGAIW